MLINRNSHRRARIWAGLAFLSVITTGVANPGVLGCINSKKTKDQPMTAGIHRGALDPIASFPDSELRAEILSQVNGELTTDALTQITSIVINRDVADLAGIELCSELTSFELTSAKLFEDIERWPPPMLRGLSQLSSLEKLTHLKISHFEVDSRQSLQLPPNLEYLSLDNSILPGLHFLEDCPSIRELNIAGSRLPSNTGIRYLRHLEILNANHVGSIYDWSALLECHSLRELYLDGNKLTDVEFRIFDAGWPKLTRLSLSYNQLTDIRFLRACPSLTTVSLEGNPISADSRRTYMQPLVERGVKVLY